jgi:hypothetical protein
MIFFSCATELAASDTRAATAKADLHQNFIVFFLFGLFCSQPIGLRLPDPSTHNLKTG